MKKYLMGAIAGATIVGGLALGGIQVLANGFGQSGNIAQELSEKLDVSQEKVESAMSEIQADRQAERKAQVSAKLDEAVTDGVITAEQKQQILDKQTEMEANRQKEREAMEAWESETGIDFSKLEEYGIGDRGMGFGGHGFGRM